MKPTVIFMGTPDFAVGILKTLIDTCDVKLVVSQPDKKVGRKQELRKTPVKELAEQYEIPVFQPEKIKADYDCVLEHDVDLIVTCAYGQLIPSAILEHPKYGCINVHASLLPKYRGGAPIHKAIMNGEKVTGITIMYMVDKMDAGNIISKAEYQIKDTDNVGILHDELSKLGSTLLAETLPKIIDGTNASIPQNEEEVTFAWNIKREEERIDFEQDGKTILNQIRGLNPWPVANFLLNDMEYKVYEAYMELGSKGNIGDIVELKKDSIGIQAKDSIIYITSLKPFGKKKMIVRDYLNGINKDELKNAKIN